MKELVLLGMVSAGQPQPILAGDDAVPIEAVQLLLSDDVAKRNQGYKQIFEERAKLISQLTVLISDPDNHVHRPASVETAMWILARLRAPEGVNVLVTYIGFPDVHHPQADEYPGIVTGGMFNKTTRQRLPAIGALIHIGEPCVDEVVKKLWTTDGGLEADACVEVLKELSQRPSVRAKLQSAIQRSAPRKRESLRKLLKMLGEGEEKVPGTSSAPQPSVGGCAK